MQIAVSKISEGRDMRQNHSKEYLEYIKTDTWQDKRLRRYNIDGGRCCMCGKQVGVGDWETHHIHYRTLGHEDIITDIATLCVHCHELLHNFYDREGGFTSNTQKH